MKNGPWKIIRWKTDHKKLIDGNRLRKSMDEKWITNFNARKWTRKTK